MAAALIGGGVILFQGALYEPLGKETTMLLVGFGGLFGMGGFLAAIFSIKCPNCKLKLFYFAIRNQKLNSWLTWLIELEECPQCIEAGANQRIKADET
jgi:hypothetical protein